MSLQYQLIEGILTANKFATTDAATQFLKEADTVRGVRIAHQQWGCGGAQVQNRAGGSAVVGVGVHIDPSQWVAGFWTNGTSTFTDDTTDAQDADAADFPMETANTDGYGQLSGCRHQFNIIGYNVGTAAASATNTVRVLEYSRSDGTWDGIVTNVWYVGPITGANAWATGERAVWSPIPADWVPMTAAHVPLATGGELLLGLYGIRIRATTSPTTTAAAATQLVLGRMHLTQEADTDNAVADFELSQEIVMAGAHIAFAVSRDTDTANVTNDAGSHASILVRPRG